MNYLLCGTLWGRALPSPHELGQEAGSGGESWQRSLALWRVSKHRARGRLQFSGLLAWRAMNRPGLGPRAKGEQQWGLPMEGLWLAYEMDEEWAGKGYDHQ